VYGVNKVIVNKNDYIRGNTVLAPQFDPSVEEEYEKLKKARALSKQDEKEKKLKGRMKILLNIACLFAIGIILIWRYSSIYSMQQNLNSIKSSITDVTRENENLNVELVTNSSMQYVENYAVSKLNMVSQDKNAAVSMNLNKQNFKMSNIKENEENSSKNLWARIVELLFLWG
jgi:cell division protein FtsL